MAREEKEAEEHRAAEVEGYHAGAAAVGRYLGDLPQVDASVEAQRLLDVTDDRLLERTPGVEDKESTRESPARVFFAEPTPPVAGVGDVAEKVEWYDGCATGTVVAGWTSKMSMRYDPQSPWDRMLEVEGAAPLSLEKRKRMVHAPPAGVSLLGGEGNTRGYTSRRTRHGHGVEGGGRNKKVWVRLVTLPRSLGGVAYGVMFDLTAFSSCMVTIMGLASGSGPQAKSGSVWIFICQGTHVGKETQQDCWTKVGEGPLQLPRPSFKASEYSDYADMPLHKSFDVYPKETVGVCIMTSSREGLVVREGEALKKLNAPSKCLKEYVVPGPNSAKNVKVLDGHLQVSTAQLISNPDLFAEEPRVRCGFVGGIIYSYAAV